VSAIAATITDDLAVAALLKLADECKRLAERCAARDKMESELRALTVKCEELVKPHRQ